MYQEPENSIDSLALFYAKRITQVERVLALVLMRQQVVPRQEEGISLSP